MNWLDKLERKFGRYAIRNLPLYIVMLYAIGAVLNILTKGSYYYYVALNPYMILHGQIWRLLGFLIVPPNASLIFIIFVLMFYYSIGESLVQVWGAFRFNMYILIAILAPSPPTTNCQTKSATSNHAIHFTFSGRIP